jgi:hypothetical protein
MVQLNHGIRLFTLFCFLANVVAGEDTKKKKHDLARRRLVYGVHEEPALALVHTDESEYEDSFGSLQEVLDDEKDWGRLLDSIDMSMSMSMDMDRRPYPGSESK